MEDKEKTRSRRFLLFLKRRFGKESCKAYALKRFPVITWIKDYNLEFLISDMIAGLTVGLTAIPQGVAYAIVAGLQPQYGLYSGFMGCFVYFFLGTVQALTIGPTAIIALLVHSNVHDYSSDFAVFLCFLSGCIITFLSLFNLGFIVNFISYPVTVGFTTAAALTIASTQLKGLFGLPGRANNFLPAVISTIKHIKSFRVQDLTLGIVTMAFLLGAEKLSGLASKKSTRLLHRRIFRFISVGKNGIAVIFGTIVAYIFHTQGVTVFTLTGKVGHGLPAFGPPPFSTTVTIQNETVFLPFERMLRLASGSIISVPLVSILETITIGKTVSSDGAFEATQEMFALGIANLFGSFVRSMPVAGSFTRSVLNKASGVKTPLGGLFTGGIVLSAFALTAVFEYIPKASLAAVILIAMYHMVDYRDFVFIWKTCKADMIPLCVTIVICLFHQLDFGILLGIIINAFVVLSTNTRPKTSQEELTVLNEEILVFRLHQIPIYPGAGYIRDLVIKSLRSKNRALIVFEGANLPKTDSTTIRAFKTLAQNLKKLNQKFAFWNWPASYKDTYARVDKELAKHFHSTDTLEELLEITLRNSEDEQEQEQSR